MTSTPTAEQQSSRSRKKFIAFALAGCIVIAGGVAGVTAASTAYGNETDRLCEVAVNGNSKVAQASAEVMKVADAALESVKGTDLPDGAGTSTSFADRPGADAIPAVKAVKASEGVVAVEAKPAVPARPSGAEHIDQVTADQAALARIKIPTGCAGRDQAEMITDLSQQATEATGELTASTQALLDDFVTFQGEEAARVAAERKAAEEQAAAEAARVAAEQAAEQAAAESGAGGYTNPTTGAWTPVAGGGGSGWTGGGSGWTGGGSTGGGTGSGSSGSAGGSSQPAAPSAPSYTIADCPPNTTQWGVTNGQLWCRTVSDSSGDF